MEAVRSAVLTVAVVGLLVALVVVAVFDRGTHDDGVGWVV
jgi:Co/Zn/Cd efflux system component